MHIDPETSNSAAREFDDFFAMCVPMTVSHTPNDGGENVFDCLRRYSRIPGECCIRHFGPPLMITPSSAIRRAFANDRRHISAFQQLSRQLLNNLALFKRTDVICLPSIKDIIEEKVVCPLSHFLPELAPCFYTPAEYADHLEALIRLMDQYPDYTVALDDAPVSAGIVFSIENELCCIVKPDEPFSIIEISEQNVVAAAGDYVRHLAGTGAGTDAVQRKITLDRISELISAIENY